MLQILLIIFMFIAAVSHAGSSVTVHATLRTVSAVVVEDDGTCLFFDHDEGVDCSQNMTVRVGDQYMTYAEYVVWRDTSAVPQPEE